MSEQRVLLNFVIDSGNEIFRNKTGCLAGSLAVGARIKFGKGGHRFEGTRLKVGPRWVDIYRGPDKLFTDPKHQVPDNF